MLYTMRKTLAAFRKTSAALTFTAATCLVGVSPAIAQTCPPTPGQGNLCTAKDFTITSAIVRGPTECTIGETISVTVRVGLTSTANQRYDIGIFTGENGEPVFGGASCSLDALVPLEPPFDGDSGSGGYRDLEGDACGDVSESDGEIFKDIQLDNVLCKDNDGDGQVDISGVVTWSSNASQDFCANPDDPSQFFPSSSSKCILDPDFNLPIIVEPPPSLTVFKVALPGTIPADGGPVLFGVDIINTSVGSDTITISTMVDNVHGDITTTVGNDITQTSCRVPQTLVPGQFYLCEFIADVTGPAGYIEQDTVTASGVDDEGNPVEGFDTAEVVIGDAIPSILLGKTVNPTEVPEPGGEVTYSVLVANETNTPILIDTFDDDLYGSIFNLSTGAPNFSTCPTGPFTLGQLERLRCSFTERVAGDPNDIITDTITADGPDIAGKMAMASVKIFDVAAAIEITKTAIPASLPEPGGTFTFELQVQNTSPVDTVTINSLIDTPYGDVTTVGGAITATNCATGAILAPSETYTCSFDVEFFGAPGAIQADTIVVRATDDDGGSEFDFDSAQVFIEDVPASIVVAKTPDVSIQEDGEPVVYTVSVFNSSTVDTVTLNGMTDDPYGDVTMVGGAVTATTCSVPVAVPPDTTYECEFTTIASGAPGDRITDTVIVSGVDDAFNIVVGSDSAVVDIVGSIDPPPPLSLRVTKVAVPTAVPVTDVPTSAAYFVRINNPNTDPIRITSATDDIYDILGDDPTKIPIAPVLSCSLPFELAPGDSELCAFSGPVDGEVGDVITDVITVEACLLPDCLLTASAEDDASVTITDGPLSIAVLKTAQPTSILTPGGPVDFDLEIINTSDDETLTLTTLSDDIYGDVTTVGGDITATSCTTPQLLAPSGGRYSCTFTAQVTGVAGTEVVDIVTATAEDSGGLVVEDSNTAKVEILGELPRVETAKTADPTVVRAPGGTVNFTAEVQNTSATEILTISSLVDDVYGDLNGRGTCAVPQNIPPTQTYTCEFPGQVTGDSAGLHRDTITVEGTDESGDLIADSDWAVVIILPIGDTPVAIPVNPSWLIGIASLTLLGLGLARIRARKLPRVSK